MATQISIPEPCHESWSDMQPIRSDCRHCSVCDRHIVDFTQKTDREILEHLRKEGRLCGRFRNDQLDRPLMLQRYHGKGSWTAWAAGVLALFSTQTLHSQTSTPPEQVITPDIPQKQTSEASLEQDSFRQVSGVICNQIGEPMTNIDVFVPTVSISTKTDENGFFILKIPIKSLRERMFLNFSTPDGLYDPIFFPSRVMQEDICLPKIRYVPLKTSVTTGLVAYVVPNKPVPWHKRLWHRITPW